MATLTADQVTLQRIDRLPWPETGRRRVMVHVVAQASPGDTNYYEIGDVPLTNFFTEGNAADTWLDVSQETFQLGVGTVSVLDGTDLVQVAPLHFVTGQTPTTTKLIQASSDVNPGADVFLSPTSSWDVDGRLSVYGGLTMKFEFVLMGFLRDGKDIGG